MRWGFLRRTAVFDILHDELQKMSEVKIKLSVILFVNFV